MPIRPLLHRLRSVPFIAMALLPAVAIPGGDAHGQTSSAGAVSSVLQEEAAERRSPDTVTPPARASTVLFPEAALFGVDGPVPANGLARGWASQGSAGTPGRALAIQTAERRGVNFMIGGGIAVVVGSLVDGDGGSLIVLGGLVAAGYGLYLYLDP